MPVFDYSADFPPGLTALTKKGKSRFVQSLQRAGLRAAKRVRTDTPVRTGTLRRGWRFKTTADGFTIANRVRYGRYVWKGRYIAGVREAVRETIREIKPPIVTE